MQKSICALVHRLGMSRGEFQEYYESHHAPLATRHFPFARYARNHVVDGDRFKWDTISEFRAKNIQVLGSLNQGPVGELMRADEAKFMASKSTASAGAEEHVIAAGAAAANDGLRTAMLIAGSEDPLWRGCLLDAARCQADGRAGVSIDFTTSWGDPAFPAAAVLWLPGVVEPVSELRQFGLVRLVMRFVETPQAKLMGSR